MATGNPSGAAGKSHLIEARPKRPATNRSAASVRLAGCVLRGAGMDESGGRAYLIRRASVGASSDTTAGSGSYQGEKVREMFIKSPRSELLENYDFDGVGSR